MINKISAPNSVPTDISDYVAQNAHMMAFMNQVNMQAFILTHPTTLDKPKIAVGAYISHGGSLYKVENDDEDITGSPSNGKVYVRVTGDATLTASFVTDISSYAYNAAYGSLTSGAYTLLPYELRKSGNDWLKYRFDMIKGIADQDLRTTDIPTFDKINTGHGNNELYAMDQNVRSSDSPTFTQISTANGPNKPVNNNDASMPSVGIGGFSYAYHSTSKSGTPSITIGSGGTWVYIAQSTRDVSTRTEIGRIAGGARVYGQNPASSSYDAYLYVIAWRIA
jgi:hypothetical protein